jgi:hypothetical protein
MLVYAPAHVGIEKHHSWRFVYQIIIGMFSFNLVGLDLIWEFEDIGSPTVGKNYLYIYDRL